MEAVHPLEASLFLEIFFVCAVWIYRRRWRTHQLLSFFIRNDRVPKQLSCNFLKSALITMPERVLTKNLLSLASFQTFGVNYFSKLVDHSIAA